MKPKQIYEIHYKDTYDESNEYNYRSFDMTADSINDALSKSEQQLATWEAKYRTYDYEIERIIKSGVIYI